MKTCLLSLIVLLPVISFAARPGGQVSHTLLCDPTVGPGGETLVGVRFSLVCRTQALAPQHSLRGCELWSSPVVPHPAAMIVPLTIFHQDAKEAFLVNREHGAEVTVTKSDMTAKIEWEEGSTTTCRKQ